LAALDDLMQKYGGEGYPNWDPEKHGPRTPGEEAEWTKGGYKRKENGLWADEKDQPLTGRQFEGKHPPGYAPGEGGVGGNYAGDSKTYGADGKIHGTAVGQGALHSAGGKYGRDAEKVWEQPSWTKMKLRSTGTGNAIRKGDYDAEGMIINKGDGGALAKDAAKDAGADPEAATEEQVEDPQNPGLKRVRRVSKVVKVVTKSEPAWVKARREKAEAAAAAGEEVVVDEEEEIIVDEEYVEEEYEEEEIIEEIVIEDEDGNIIEDEEGLDGGSTHDVSALQTALSKRANEQKLLA
jgi:hypothetical protein